MLNRFVFLRQMDDTLVVSIVSASTLSTSSVAISETGSGTNVLKLFGAAGKYGMASVSLGFGRLVTLDHRLSTSYQIRVGIRCPYF